MSRNKEAVFSRDSDDWETPEEIIKQLRIKFGVKKFFDPCPYMNDIKKWNGLEGSWKDWNFVNPPYSETKQWIGKALIELRKGKNSIFLIPSRTDTKIWQEVIFEKAKGIYFVNGRIKFVGGLSSAPFPSDIIVFSNSKEKQKIDRISFKKEKEK